MPLTSAGGASTASAAESIEARPTASATSPVAWVPGEELDVRDWVRAGQRLGALTRCSQWWLGDWVRYGTGRWGEKYKEASRITGYDVKTLRNIAYVAGAVDVSRRRDNLTWSHHAEVCALDAVEQDRWLDLALTQRMSVADLRIEVRAAERAGNGSEDRVQAHAKEVTCPACEHRFPVPAL
jgi:hypothetical protein